MLREMALVSCVLFLAACSGSASARPDDGLRSAEALSRDFTAIISTFEAAAATPESAKKLRSEWRNLGLERQLDTLTEGVFAMPAGAKSAAAKTLFLQAIGVLRGISELVPEACKTAGPNPGDGLKAVLKCYEGQRPTQLDLNNGVFRARAAWDNGLALLR